MGSFRHRSSNDVYPPLTLLAARGLDGGAMSTQSITDPLPACIGAPPTTGTLSGSAGALFEFCRKVGTGPGRSANGPKLCEVSTVCEAGCRSSTVGAQQSNQYSILTDRTGAQADGLPPCTYVRQFRLLAARPGGSQRQGVCWYHLFGIQYSRLPLPTSAGDMCTQLHCSTMMSPLAQVYETIEHALYHQTHLFYNRHIDQIMLSALYGYCKVHKLQQVRAILHCGLLALTCVCQSCLDGIRLRAAAVLPAAGGHA